MADLEESDVHKFYERFMASDVKKSKKELNDEILYQLYKKVTKDPSHLAPKIMDPPDHTPNLIQQADLLYMPTDDGYMYGLTVVDTGSRITDCEPMRERSAADALAAIKTIYARKILKEPSISIEVDSGSEFKGVFAQYFKDRNVFVRVAQTGRSRQQGLVENRNGLIGRTLLRRMAGEELLTKEKSVEWVQYLPKLITWMNKEYMMKKITLKPKEILADVKVDKKKKNNYLEEGTVVRVQLDKPADALTGRKLHGTFREGDILWSMKAAKIKRIQMIPNQPVMYKVEGYTPLFTINQLQVVNLEKAKLPPKTIQIKYVVKEILKKKNSQYLIWWDGYDKADATWEPIANITEDVPTIAAEFEKAMAAKKKKK